MPERCPRARQRGSRTVAGRPVLHERVESAAGVLQPVRGVRLRAEVASAPDRDLIRTVQLLPGEQQLLGVPTLGDRRQLLGEVALDLVVDGDALVAVELTALAED